MKLRNNITREHLIETFKYDPETGIFIWLKTNNKRIKKYSVAGSLNANGYIRLKINSEEFLAHRLAWLYMTGFMPKQFIDHINGDRSDNRFCNLREATASQNVKNARIRNDNKSGEKGVCWDKGKNKWMVCVGLNGKNKFLGRFDNLETASEVYKDFAKNNHGDFYYEKSRGLNNA